jgi:hypothetical protein
MAKAPAPSLDMSTFGRNPGPGVGVSAAAPATPVPAFDPAQPLTTLKHQGATNLSNLMSEDDAAARAEQERNLYDSSARGINEAADLERGALLEGTFARGVGPSSITTELAGRLGRSHEEALAQAGRDAYTGAGNEVRADRASRQGLYTGGFNAGMAGEQGYANIDIGRGNLALGGRNADLNERNLEQQNEQFYSSLAQGNIASGLGGLASFFQPTIEAGGNALNDWLRGQLGIDT